MVFKALVATLFLGISNGAKVLTGQATCTVDSDSFTIDMTLDPVTTNKAVIVLKGPNTKDFFAVALNAQAMNGNGYLLAGGSTNDWKQMGRVTGYTPPSSTTWNGCTAVSAAVNNERTITFTCNLSGDYTFPTAPGTINTICTLGDNTKAAGTEIRKHEQGKHAKPTITLAEKVAPTATTTKMTMGTTKMMSKTTTKMMTKTTTKMMSKTTTKMMSKTTTAAATMKKLTGSIDCTVGGNKFTYSLTIDHTTKKVTVKFSGPNSVDYFGVALNAQSMADGGFLLAVGSKNKFSTIGKTAAGKVNAGVWNNCKIDSNTDANMMRTAQFTCDTTGQYTFPTKAGSINAICTLGAATPASAVAYHGSGRYQKPKITITEMGSGTTVKPADNNANKVFVSFTFFTILVISLLY